MKTWIRPEPGHFTAAELLRRAGVTRVGQYDFERAAPGHLFHEDCGYLWNLHDNTIKGRPLPFGCPSETDAREAWGR